MRRRLRVFLLGVASGGAATVALRSRLGARRERLDVYFADGSFVTFGAGSSTAEQLLPLAGQVLAAVGRRT